MKIRLIFLLSLFCLLLINHSYAATLNHPDLESGEGNHLPAPTHTSQIAVDIDSSEPAASASKSNNSHSCFPVCEMLTGSVLSFSGYVMMGAGGVITAVSPDLTSVSIPLLGIGGGARKAGGMFFNAARNRAALLEQELDHHVAEAISGVLSEKEIEALSDKFFAADSLYTSYLRFSSRFDNIFAQTLNFIGLPLTLVGMGFTASGEHTVGPILIATGVAVHDLSTWFKSRAEALTAQKTRIAAIGAAKTRAGER